MCCLFVNWIVEYGIDEQNFVASKKKKKRKQEDTPQEAIFEF